MNHMSAWDDQSKIQFGDTFIDQLNMNGSAEEKGWTDESVRSEASQGGYSKRKYQKQNHLSQLFAIQVEIIRILLI